MMAKNVVCMQDKQMQDMDILSEDAETELAMGARPPLLAQGGVGPELRAGLTAPSQHDRRLGVIWHYLQCT